MTIKVKKSDITKNIPHMSHSDGSIRPSNANILNVFDNGEMTPVVIKESTVLGTTSELNLNFFDNPQDAERLNTPNPQKVEVAYLDPDANTFCVQGSVNFVPRCMELTAYHANPSQTFDLADLVRKVMQFMKDKGGMKTLAEKYASRLVDGSILFRNRFADDLRAVISFQNGDAQALEFDCRAEDFGNREGLAVLTRHIETALTDPEQAAFFHPSYKLYGRINYGGEVYPSQELVMGGGKELFRNKIMGERDAAGIHSQKVGNALRTIDTWYSRYSEIKKALPVDPFGPDKSSAKAQRRPNEGETFYEIMAGLDQLYKQLEETGEPSNDAMFFAAMMVRGGVFTLPKAGRTKKDEPEAA